MIEKGTIMLFQTTFQFCPCYSLYYFNILRQWIGFQATMLAFGIKIYIFKLCMSYILYRAIYIEREKVCNTHTYRYISLFIRGWAYLVTKVCFTCTLSRFIVPQYWVDSIGQKNYNFWRNGSQYWDKTEILVETGPPLQFSKHDNSAADKETELNLDMLVALMVGVFSTPFTPSLSLKIAGVSYILSRYPTVA